VLPHAFNHEKPEMADLISFGHTANISIFPKARTDKKEKKIFLIYKEIQSGAVAKSYMRKGFQIYEEMRQYISPYMRRR
jgi:hypothetical protein